MKTSDATKALKNETKEHARELLQETLNCKSENPARTFAEGLIDHGITTPEFAASINRKELIAVANRCGGGLKAKTTKGDAEAKLQYLVDEALTQPLASVDPLPGDVKFASDDDPRFEELPPRESALPVVHPDGPEAKKSKIVVVKKDTAQPARATEPLPPPAEPKSNGKPAAEKKERTINLPDVFNGVAIPDYRKAPISDLQDCIEKLSGKRPRSQDRNYYREQLMLITRDLKNSFFLCPSELLERANATAKAEGISRSDLVVKALEAYLS